MPIVGGRTVRVVSCLLVLAGFFWSGVAAAVGVALPPASEDPDLKAAWQAYQAEQFVPAAHHYARAARHGQPIGEYNWAIMLLNGQGTHKNAAEGRLWLRRAAGQGLAQAQYDLGLLYENGEGVPKSQTEAVHWYALAADQGHVDAQMTLATQYFLGRGVQQDYALAAKWYESAAEGGVEAAQYIIASCYEHGDGVPLDLDRALYWYIQAQLQGDAVAADKVRVLKEALRHSAPT